LVVALFVWLALWLTVPVAIAAETESSSSDRPPQPSPSVSFLDSRPLTVKLTTLQAGGGLELALHNDGGTAQKLSLRVVGLDDAEEEKIRGLLGPAAASVRSVPAGGLAKLTLPVDAGVAESGIEAGSYEAQLIASGRRGGLARRALTISVEATPAPAPHENVVTAAHAVDLTFVAVNFLPSLLSNVTSFFLFVFLLLALILASLRRQLRRLDSRLPVLLVAIALAALIGTAVAFNYAKVWNQPSANWISARPIPVAEDVEDGDVGTAASANGTIAQVVVSGKELRATDLDTATTYSGTYDLDPDPEAGSAKATINVRDYWPYAAITIALGLLIAYYLRLWYQSRRPRTQLLVRYKALVQSYEIENDTFESRAAGRPYGELSLDGRLGRVKSEIERLQDEGNAKAAGELLDKLSAYLDEYSRLRTELESLDQACEGLLRLPGLDGFHVDRAEIASHRVGQELLVAAHEALQLGSKLGEIESQEKLVRAVTLTAQAVLRHLAALDLALPHAGTKKKDLETQRGQLLKAGGEALRAGSIAAVEKANEGVAAAATALRAVEVEISEAAGRAAAEGPVFAEASDLDPRLLRDVRMGGISGKRSLFFNAPIDVSLPGSAPDVSISWQGPDDTTPGSAAIYREDKVLFTFAFSSDQPLAFSKVEILFGDGAVKSGSVDPESGEATLPVSHRYLAGGDLTITVRSLPEHDELATFAVKVDPETKVEYLKRQLRDSDRAVAVAAFVLAVGSGMAKLYLGDASWGEPTDYVTALLWGGLAGEGVKLAASIADRVFPSS
jgi:hypothetical protein